MATLKQKKAVEKLLEKVGKPVGEAMLEVGYTKASAKNPKILTESKGWEELMEKFLPDKLLAKKHKELLTVPIRVKVKKAGLADIETEMLDTFAISKGLEMAYKLKGRFAPEKHDLTSGGKPFDSLLSKARDNNSHQQNTQAEGTDTDSAGGNSSGQDNRDIE